MGGARHAPRKTMKSPWLLALAASLACTALAAQQMPGRAFEGTPEAAPQFRSAAPFATHYQWPPEDKSALPKAIDDGRRLAVGRVRNAPKSFAALDWR